MRLKNSATLSLSIERRRYYQRTINTREWKSYMYKQTTYNMESERLFYRRFMKSDFKDLFEYLSDPEAVRFEPYRPLSLRQCVDEAKSRAESRNYWAAVLKSGEKMIGNIFFKQKEPLKFMTWELGYIFNKRYWGEGYATEASKRIVRYGFEELGAHRIIANCNQLNERSFRLMERLGMRREQSAKRDVFFHYGDDAAPLWQDSFQYAILAEEYFGNDRR